jgi:hypothetical protein
VQFFEHISGHINGPACDRGERPRPADHRRGSQRQHRRHRMIPPLSRPPIAHPRKQFQQVTGIRHRPAEDSEPPARQVIGEPGYQPPVRRERES